MVYNTLNGCSDESSDIARCLKAFRKSDEEREALVEDLVRKYEELKNEFALKDDDYKNELNSRRMWQRKAEASEATLKQVSISNSFALGIIDGDGALFQDALLSQGKDGGARAAQLLHDEMKKHLRLKHPDANVSDWNIVVHVILNLQGLSNRLQAGGIINNPNELAAFGRAFGLAQPLFSFIDVGGGKERADHKIRETLRLYMPISQCKHIFFAPCHDNGYLPVLEAYRFHTGITERLTLIETRPAESGFTRLGLTITKMPGIFRNSDLPSKPLEQHAFDLPLAPARSQTIESTSSNGIHPKHPDTPSPRPSPATTATTVSNASSWAAVGKSSPLAEASNNKIISIAPSKPKLDRKSFFLNVHGERVDVDLPRADMVSTNSLHKRMKDLNAKFCNSHYLGGYCESGSECYYIHTEKLTPGEILALRHKARSGPCRFELACRDFDCFYGHNCKFSRDCRMADCHWARSHNMDTTKAQRVFDDGTIEWSPAFINGTRN